jgi:two-component system KDP operon response regulator KdpE
MTKPFSTYELMARIRANLRRTPATQSPVNEVLEIGDFRIDQSTRTVTVKSAELKLTPKEFDLLTYLARHPRRVIPHRTLLAAVWGDVFTQQPEYLRVFVGQLRKKIEDDPANPCYLLTERWVGYRFEPGD